MNFQRTTTHLDGHYHIAYINEREKVGALSFDAEHTHEYVWIEPQEAQLDEMGQEIAPAQPGGWQMSPGPDGHIHEVIPYEAKVPQKKQSEEEVVSDVHNLLREAWELERTSIERGRESVRFVLGEQWDELDRSSLESAGRAALTINLLGPKVDELCGYQTQQRQDLRFTPEEGGDQVTADILNAISKKVLSACSWEREESEIFWNQVVAGRGSINVRVEFDRDYRGQIIAESYPWDEVLYGPHEKKDLSDCEYLIKHRMYSKARIERDWPDKADDIGIDFQSIVDSPSKHVTYQFNQYAHSDNVMPVSKVSLGDMTLVDVARKEYRIIECWRREYDVATVLAAPGHDVYERIDGWSSRDIEAARTIPGVYAIKRNSSHMRITKIAGGVLLSDENPADLPIQDFFCFPVYGIRKNGEFQGKVERAKDPQREVNKRHSQSIDIGNKMCAYGWFHDQSTFNGNGLEEFKRNANSPGFIQEVTDQNRPPTQVQGTKFPSELVQLMEIDRTFVDQLMMVNVPPNGANESGAMYMNRQKLALQGSEYLFDNLAFAKKHLGKLIVACIQRYWSKERILRLLRSQASRPDMKLAGEHIDSYTDEAILDVLNNADVLRYDVEITESQYSPTQRMATLMLLRDFAQAGVQVPPELFPEFMDAPADVKERILEAIKAQQEAQSVEASKTDSAEVQKTLIAQGIIPPAVAQAQGVDPNMSQPAKPPLQGGGALTESPSPMQDKMDMFSAIGEIINAIKTTPPQLPPINVNIDTRKGSVDSL